MATILHFTRIKTRWFYTLAPYKACEGLLAIVFPLYLFNILQLSVSMVGVLTGLTSLGAVLGSICWGYISDHYHIRRAIIVQGYLLSGLCLAGIGLVTQLLGLSLLCFGFGFFSIAPAPISSVLIMETLAKSQWDNAFGRFNLIGGWGSIVGLAVGMGVLPVLQWWVSPAQSLRVIVWGLSALMIATAGWGARTIPEPKRRVNRSEFLTVTRRMPRLAVVERVFYLPRRLLFVLRPSQMIQLKQTIPSATFSRYLIATGMMFISFLCVITLMPLYLQNVHQMDSTLIVVLMLARALASVPFYTLAGRWMSRYGAHQVQVWAVMGRCLAFGILSVIGLVSADLILMSAMVVCNALVGLTWSGFAVAGPALVGRLTAPKQQGEAMGLYNAIQGIGQILGALLGGYLAHAIGYHLTFFFSGLLLLPAMVLLWRVKPQSLTKPIEPLASSHAA